MRRFLIYILPVLVPVLMVIGLNEYSRRFENKKPYQYMDVKVMNSNKADKSACTWQCHNNTAFCKEHHVILLKPYFSYSDPVYFGIIQALKSTGNYAGANIVFLAILWPLLMYWLLVKVILSEFRLRALKKKIYD